MDEVLEGPSNRELYALLNLSPDASDEEIRRAYRQWAQAYHPDKYQAPHMKDIATANFQRICEAYEVLSDPNKRQIYDIYGMEGLNSGLELGAKLDKAEEIKAELERLRRMKEMQKMAAHFRTSGTILANISLPRYRDGDGLMRGYSSVHYISPSLLIVNRCHSSQPLRMNLLNDHMNAGNIISHSLSNGMLVIGSVKILCFLVSNVREKPEIHQTQACLQWQGENVDEICCHFSAAHVYSN